MRRLMTLAAILGTFAMYSQVGIGTIVPSAELEIEGTGTLPALELNPQVAPVGTATGQIAVIGDQLYMYDATRAKWLSASATPLTWSKNGSADDENLRFGGDVADTNSGAAMPYNGTIVFVSARASGGLATKGFEIRRRNGPFTWSTTPFNLVGGNFRDTSYNVDFNAGEYINVYAVAAGAAVTNAAVTVWVKWRQ